MHLMFTPVVDAATGKQVGRDYTLKKVIDGQVTKSAHPARFSPDDKWSRHRIALRQRFAPLLGVPGMFVFQINPCFRSLYRQKKKKK